MRRKQLVIVLVVWLSTLLSMMFIIPSIIVIFKPDLQQKVPHGDENISPSHTELLPIPNQPVVPVWLADQGVIESVSLESYVRGVVAAEMPIDFELEALKAQAIVARTYIIRRMMTGDFSDVDMEGAIVTNTVQHQAYLSEEQLAERWSWLNRAKNIEKLNRAVNETAGMIVTYEGEPIQALYFSTSNGYTENAEEYFAQSLPYLQSVPSPWDEMSPKYEHTLTFSLHDVYRRLELPDLSQNDARVEPVIKAMTTGHRIKTIDIAGHSFSGREVREALDLPSSSFTWEIEGEQMKVNVTGYGHGVGMSQYGAQGQAQEGQSAENIIQYYYQNVEIQNINDLNLDLI